MGRKGIKKLISKFDSDFQYLIELDSRFEDWRVLAAEWHKINQAKNTPIRHTSLTKFFVEYIHVLKLDKSPKALLAIEFDAPPLSDVLNQNELATSVAHRTNDEIFDFVEWVLKGKYSEANEGEFRKVLPGLRNPFRRLVKKKVIIDDDFNFLLDIDPFFGKWNSLAAEWCAGVNNRKDGLYKNSLAKFFKEYLYALGLAKTPLELLDSDYRAPSLWEALNLDALESTSANRINDVVSDFFSWILTEKISKISTNTFQEVANKLRNPFPRKQTRITGKRSDAAYGYILDMDPRMSEWVGLAIEWLGDQRVNYAGKRVAIDHILSNYLLKSNLDRNPYTFLRRDYSKPEYIKTLTSKKKNPKSHGSITAGDIKSNNIAHDFFDWILKEKLSVEDDNGEQISPHEFHNPIQKMTQRGVGLAETLKSPLPYRYIRELRDSLAQGSNFRDWTWAHGAMDARAGGGGDWFIVDQSKIVEDDPDCKWRERKTSTYEQKNHGLPPVVFELWSPVRAVALYIKLELPLRTFQVRMLDSGEADTWRYESGKWAINKSSFALGTEKRPNQRGVFHRGTNEVETGFFINTNKTADINKDEYSKGYVIPWTYQPVLYWLEKLRNWQEKYNPIPSPTRWRDLEGKHFGGSIPHPSVLDERGTCCFLFRNAAASGSDDRAKPIGAGSIDRLWYLLLSEFEKRCAANNQTLSDGSAIRFVDPQKDSVTYYPLHALRVSLITAYALEGGVPFPILSKLIAGHARIIMTIYYTKAGKAHVTEVMKEADTRILKNEVENYRRFLMEKSYKELEERFAFNSLDALNSVAQNNSAASFMFEDKGICPVGGGLCGIGGEVLRECQTDPSKNVYGPVAGYPQERNCVRCRFFLTGPAFLPGLQAHFNWISYKVSECSERYVRLDLQVKALEDALIESEERGVLFTQHAELERINRFYEEEAEKANKLLTDFQSVTRLIDRCVEIGALPDNTGIHLVAAGDISDVKYALYETESELHQLEVICEDAVIYPEIDAGKAVLRRSQMLDAMLQINGRSPIFFRLNEEQQLYIGNEVMNLIQARSGSFKNAVEFIECKRILSDIGLLDEAVGLIEEKSAGVAFRNVIDVAQSDRTLGGQTVLGGDDNEP